MKIKIFNDAYESEINEFIKDKKIIDIKYSITQGIFSALIMYEEEK